MTHKGLMLPSIWNALRPHLEEIASIDFSGGGEPLLQPHLEPWMTEAKSHGCQTGLLTNALLLTPEKGESLRNTGLDWICFSVDGADKQTYESIRIGSDFERVCTNISTFCRLAGKQGITTMLNVVIMTLNRHQIEDMVRLASDLGVSRVNFKHCDVIREDLGKDLGVFASHSGKDIRGIEKSLNQAKKLGRKRGVTVTWFSFTPEEKPVCVQDPRDSLFIRYDGWVSPCIGLAYGGPTTFLGKDAIMPSVRFGCLDDEDLSTLVQSPVRKNFVGCLEKRVSAYEEGFLSVDLSEPSLPKLKAANRAAIYAMPPAPDGCRACHYLHGI